MVNDGKHPSTRKNHRMTTTTTTEMKSKLKRTKAMAKKTIARSLRAEKRNTRAQSNKKVVSKITHRISFLHDIVSRTVIHK